MKKLIALCLMVISVMTSFGQSEEELHPIDIRLKECLDSTENQTTYGMTECSIRAGAAWEKELNKNYKQLMEVLSADEKERLKTAQRSWLLYRDNEIDFAQTIYTNLQGTMWQIVSADREADITRRRALELKAYFDDMPLSR